MLGTEGPIRHGLPPRERNADVTEHTGRRSVWIGGAIVVLAVLGLMLFGTTRMNDTTATNLKLATEAGTTGAAPSSSAKHPQ